jgi:hypothetical protein
MDLIFTVTEEEASKIVTSLAQLPYAQVYALIAKLQSQAIAQKPEK